MIERFSRGVEFTAKRDVYELDYAVAEVPFGRVSFLFISFFFLSLSLSCLVCLDGVSFFPELVVALSLFAHQAR